MNQPAKLSLEQEFQLRAFTDQVERMSGEQAREFLLEFYKLAMHKENMYKHFLNQEWGINSDPASV
ncbi:NblA/ycf18 family protein [Lyngbya aestuarii]|uniref:NblA/ycf18 family protein n=1 Tax=Lyngbya aestuarii TaxID=118322 RepID=UPI00403D9134